MRLTMISIGSTGDVRPYVILGQELVRRGHEVRIASFSPFENMVKDAGLDFYPLAGDVVKFMASIMKPGTNGITYLQKVQNAIRDVAGPLLNNMQTACKGAEAIITTFFGSSMYSIAEKNHVPCIQTQYYPMDYNDVVPISSAPGLKAGKAWNKMTYKVGYLLINSLEHRYLTGWRREQGMRVRKIRPRPDYTVNGHQIPVLYAVSPLMMPRPLSWNEHIHMTGFWMDPKAPEYTPDPKLSAFLAAGEKPVYIGFGSMVSGDMGKTLSIVLEAVEQAGIRAILQKGWGGAEITAPSSRVYVADFIPHEWLFEQVAAVTHHGGAGTTAAGLKAGKPTLVIPFGGDQPFWGMRVRALGLGPKPIRREFLTAERLTKALIDLTQTKSYCVAAKELGMRLREENGTKIAADIIEEEIQRWLSEDKNKLT
jgi:sterol 3beta-glucosyltransferase